MGSIPLPALDVRTPQQPNLLQQYSQLAQLQNMRQEQQQRQQEAPLRMQALQTQAQSGQLQLQQQQQAVKDQQSFRAAMTDPALHGKTIGEVADALAQKGQISQAGWVAAKKADLDNKTGLAKLDDTQLSNAAAAHKQTQELYNNVMNLPDDQLVANWPSIAQQYDAIPGNNKQPLNPNQPLTKAQLQQFGPLISMQQSYLSSEMAKRKTAADVQQLEGKSDPASPFYAPSQASISMGTAPGAAQIQAGEVRQAGAKSAAEAKAKQPYEMQLAAQRQALSQGDPSAAAQLLIDGDATLSELKARGSTPSFISRTLYEAKRMSGGKYNAQAADAQYNVARSPANVAFFGSANSLLDKGGTLDQLEAAGKDIPHSQIPVLNTLADWEKAATGSGPLAKYASIALGAADDYSKVMTGSSQGSDTSRMQALKLFATNLSAEGRAGSISGVRGAVGSQVTGRIGKNPVLGRMYGSEMSGSSGTSDPLGIR